MRCGKLTLVIVTVYIFLHNSFVYVSSLFYLSSVLCYLKFYHFFCLLFLCGYLLMPVDVFILLLIDTTLITPVLNLPLFSSLATEMQILHATGDHTAKTLYACGRQLNANLHATGGYTYKNILQFGRWCSRVKFF